MLKLALISLGLLLNLPLWLGALYLFPQDDPTTILHYSVGLGIDFIGQGNQIVVLPAAGLAILVGNSLLSLALRIPESATAWILLSVAPIAQLILLASFILIWQANV